MPITSFGNPVGAFKASVISGTMAAGMAAAGEIIQFRFVSSTSTCVVKKVTLDGMYQLTGFTAGAGLFELVVCRAFSAVGTGGTVMTQTTNLNRMRTAQATVGGTNTTIRFPTTAALGAGTKVLDTNPMGQLVKFVPGATNTQVFEPTVLFDSDPGAEKYPLILATSEGFSIRATVPATGTWVVGCTIEWDEVTTY